MWNFLDFRNVGSYRAVLVAFHSDTREYGVWLVGDAHTGAAQLVAGARADAEAAGRPSHEPPTGPSRGRVNVIPAEPQPFAGIGINDPASDRYLALGVAPGGCQVATKDHTHPQTWRDEATVSYVARTDQLGGTNSTFARVTCDGVVRYQGPIPHVGLDLSALGLTDQQLDAVRSGARGTVPSRELARQALDHLRYPVQLLSLQDCRIAFAGRAPGADPGHAPDILVMCPVPGGSVFLSGDERGGGTGGSTRFRLDDPHGMFAAEEAEVFDMPTGASASPPPFDPHLLLAERHHSRLEAAGRGGQVSRQMVLTRRGGRGGRPAHPGGAGDEYPPDAGLSHGRGHGQGHGDTSAAG